MKQFISACVAFCVALLGANLAPEAAIGGGGKPIEIKLDSFIKEWKADRAATGKKYAGKMVTFTGPIFRFHIDNQRNPAFSVRVESGNDPNRINVHAKGVKEPWTSYGLGQTVTVRGKFEYDGTAVVRDAVVTTTSKNPTITLKSADLAAEATPDRDKAAKKYMDQGAIVVGEVVKMSDRKDVVYLKGKGEVLIECLMHPVDQPQLGASLTVGTEARIFGVVKEQLNPILDDSKAFRLRECFPIAGAKKK
jgi:hypothetical protein